jgi:hypothetical protein
VKEFVAKKKEPSEGLRNKTVVSLAERGPLLALGIVEPGGALNKSLEVREWKAKQERELGRLRENLKTANMAEYVGHVLATMCTRIGPHDFTRMSDKERRLVVSQMAAGDVFHAYCWLRYSAIGAELPMTLDCPVCGRSFDWVGDLGSLTISVVDKLEDSYWEYKLINPMEIRGKRVETLWLCQPAWHRAETSRPESRWDFESGKLAVICGAIRGAAELGEIPLADNEIDELSKRDLEGIVGQFDQHLIGPDMRIEAKCPTPQCRALVLRTVDWNYQSFFAVSSPSRT